MASRDASPTASDLDVGWLDGVLPQARRTHLVSGDRDLRPVDIVELVHRYDAVAADWESAAMADVATRRGTPLAAIMPALFDQLPPIVRAFRTA